jgi:hypothetical protein
MLLLGFLFKASQCCLNVSAHFCLTGWKHITSLPVRQDTFFAFERISSSLSTAICFRE